MKPRLVRGIIFYLLAAIPLAACAEATRDFNTGSSGAAGTGEQTTSSSSGMGGQAGTGGGGTGGKQSTGGSGGTGAAGGGGGSGTGTAVGGAGGSGAGITPAGGSGGAGGGQGETCIWIDITMADCSSGIMIADFCPAPRHVTQLERCDMTLFTPDAEYQKFKLSGCPGVCPLAADHVAWRRIECCL